MLKKIILTLLLLSVALFSNRSVAAQASGPVYIVQPGDSLSSIAARFNVSLNDLMTANSITDPNQISAGQQLIIPGLEGVTGLLDSEIVNFGDSYRSLIRRTHIPENIFRKLNHIVSPSEFFVGASMIVPVRDTDTNQKTRFSPAKGASLLEEAVRRNTDPWTLVYMNSLGGTWDGIPSDTLFAPGGTDNQETSGLPSAFISAAIRDLPLKQGGTGVIKVKTQTGVTLGGILVDHPLHFFMMDDGTQVALQGIHALLEPGLYPMRLDATLSDGSVQSFEQTILILSGNYPEDPILYVDPGTIDPAVTEPELKQLNDITSIVTPQKYWSDIFTSPASEYAESTYFTSGYGNRRLYIGLGTELKVPGFHTGLDFGGGVGLPITSPAAGKVVFASPWTVRGNATIIDHGWGVFSGFWHQSKFDVQVGDMVEQGQKIGEVGGTGRVTGAHLHWELWVNGIQVDPLNWLNLAYP